MNIFSFFSAPLKGDLKSDREKTSTDRNRERRAKKAFQKKKAKRQEEILKIKSQKTDKNGLLSKSASASIVKKALKTGQVKMVSFSGFLYMGLILYPFQLEPSNDLNSKKRKIGDSTSGTSSKKKKSA